MERARYEAIKDSEHFKLRQRDYRATLRQRLDADPEFAAIFRAHARARLRAWRERVRSERPEQHAALKASERERYAAWRRQIESDPAAWEAHKARVRAWYAALSVEERRRIFKKPIATTRV